MTRTLQTLVADSIDYAGLFPPAELSMRDAVENYAKYRAGEYEWMLARFICPVSRLAEFADCADGHLPTDETHEPWPISTLIDGDLDRCIDQIFEFNAGHEDGTKGRAIIDSIELRATSPSMIDDALEMMPHELQCYFEVPAATMDVRGYITALAGNDAAAKIRTGGVTPDAIPATHCIAQFLNACSAADVPFKATAGLHHPIRAPHALTYEKDAPRATMHGFLNVFLAAALIREHGLDEHEGHVLLDTIDPKAFLFEETVAGIGDYKIDVVHLARWREEFALSFGSCSFEEPIADLKAMGLL